MSNGTEARRVDAEIDDTDGAVNDTPLSVQKLPGSSVLEKFLETGKGDPLERLEAMTEFLKKLRLYSIQQCYPSDFVIHVATDDAGTVISERAYLQDIGCDRGGKPWGIVEMGEPTRTKTDFADGTYLIEFKGPMYSRVTGEMAPAVLGSAWSGDRFFRKGLVGDESVNPSNVVKKAAANFHGRGVRRLAGLGGIPLEELSRAGLDVSKCVRVTWAKGAKGGESTGVSTGGSGAGHGPVLNFGKSKGKHASEVSDKDLGWYIKALGENVADPSKAQYADRNQVTLDALLAEQERRKNPASSATNADKPAEPQTRGQRLMAIQARLKGAVKAQGALLSYFKVDVLSDLTDEQLAQCEAMTDAQLRGEEPREPGAD